MPPEPSPQPYRWGSSPPVLESARLRLRALEDRDVDDVFVIFGDPDVMRYWSFPAFRERDQAVHLIETIRRDFASRTSVLWGVARRDDDVVVGTCRLFHFEAEHRRAEIGFALRRGDWGRGLASEAVATVADFAFGPLDLIRIEGDADPRNERSIRLLERLGFVREGLLRHRYIVAGEVQDTLYLGLLREDWSARR